MAESVVEEILEKDFDEKVLKSKKPVLVDFYAPWCHGCHAIATILESVAKDLKNVKIVKFNIDTNPQIASKYHVLSLPTLLIFSKGEIKKHITNGFSEDELKEKLAEIK